MFGKPKKRVSIKEMNRAIAERGASAGSRISPADSKASTPTKHASFSASSAYFGLMQQRIEELHEMRDAGLQTRGEFMERRLAPAMQTCTWVARRQQALSERISRISNQELLNAMNGARRRNCCCSARPKASRSPL